MISLKDTLKDIYDAVEGICDKRYLMERPSASEARPDNYIVVALPISVYDNELSQDGSFEYYSTIGRVEVYVRDRISASNPRTVDVITMDEKVRRVMSLFPISTDNIHFARPRITLQTSDGTGFHVTHIEGELGTVVKNKSV